MDGSSPSIRGLRFFVVVLAALLAPRSLFGASLGGTCRGDSTDIGYVVYADYGDPPEGSLVVTAQPLGRCTPAIIVSPEPVPYPTWSEERLVVKFRIPTPFPGFYTRYRIWRMDSEGTLHRVASSGDLLAWDLIGCPDDVFARGAMSTWLSPYDLQWHTRFLLCEDQCWADIPVDFLDAPPGSQELYESGEVVELYGNAWIDGMPGATRLMVTRVETVDDGVVCLPVATERRSWGSIKARYR